MHTKVKPKKKYEKDKNEIKCLKNKQGCFYYYTCMIIINHMHDCDASDASDQYLIVA